MESKILTKGFSKMNICISNKEKKLLIILLFVIFLWVINKFILTAQAANITELEQEKTNHEVELEKINSVLEKDKSITDQWNVLDKEIENIRLKYFSDIDQPKIMYLLNEIIDDTSLYVASMNFSGPDSIEINDAETKYFGISIPFEGSYDDLGSFFSQLRTSPKKFLVTNLTLSKIDDNLLNGQIGLNVYSCDEIVKCYKDYVYNPETQDVIKDNPFKTFAGYKENIDIEIDAAYNSEGISIQITDDSTNRTSLENFENNDIYFMTSNSNVTGKVSRFNSSKFGNHSLRIEYFISTENKEERAYVVLDDKDIILKYPPSSIGLWAYSYAYSPVTLGFRLMDQEGNKIDLELVRGVNWMGWEYIEAKPPQDINLYPLKLDRVYLELAANRDDYGVMLFDDIEVSYPTVNNEESEVQIGESYSFYILKYGDTLESISEEIYGTTSKAKEIMKQNGLSSNVLEEGQILVIQK